MSDPWSVSDPVRDAFLRYWTSLPAEAVSLIHSRADLVEAFQRLRGMTRAVAEDEVHQLEELQASVFSVLRWSSMVDGSRSPKP